MRWPEELGFLARAEPGVIDLAETVAGTVDDIDEVFAIVNLGQPGSKSRFRAQ